MRRFGFLFLLFYFLLMPCAFGAVGYDTSSQAFFGATTGNSWSHTITGTNPAIICSFTLWDYSGTTTATATYNAVSLTAVSGGTNIGNFRKINMFYGAAPAVGSPYSAAFTLDLEASVLAACSSFTGAHQTTPVGTAVTSLDIVTGINVTIPTSGMAYDVAYIAPGPSCDGAFAPTASGQTSVIDFNTECADAETQMGASTRTSGSSFTWDNAGPYDDGMVGVPISQAATAVVRRRGPIQQ